MFLKVCVFMLQAYLSTAFSVEAEEALRQQLFSNYTPSVRPNSVVDVKVFFNLLTIHELDVKTQKFTIAGWLTVKWSDKRLSWDSTLHGDIKSILVSETQTWTPQLIVENSANQVTPIGDPRLLALLDHNGDVEWEVPGIFVTHCHVVIKYYPFDIQTCKLLLTSWSYSVSKVNLTHSATVLNMENYEENGEWEIKKIDLGKGILFEGDEEYHRLEFNFKVSRRPVYYIINLIIPTMLTSVLSVVVFLLPAESGEKATYALTVLLFLALLLLTVTSTMPTTSLHVSILGIYFILTLVYTAVVVIVTILLLRIYNRSQHEPVPPWLQRLAAGCLSKLTCCQQNKINDVDASVMLNAREISVLVKTAVQNSCPEANGHLEDDAKKGVSQTKEYGWPEVLHMLDAFCFCLFTVIWLLMTIAFGISFIQIPS